MLPANGVPTTNGSKPRTIHTTINYVLDPAADGPPPYYYYPGTAGHYRRKFNVVPVEMTDLRGIENNFDLDTHGFKVAKFESVEKDFQDSEVVKSTVYEEISRMLRENTGATRVLPFSHLRRHGSVKTARVEDALKDLKDDDLVRGTPPAAQFVHVDQSYSGAVEILEDNLDPVDVARLTKTRWGIINVWHPIHNPVTRDPLAVCDARSVSDADLRGVSAVLPGQSSDHKFVGVTKGARFESWHLVPNPSHQWYYASQLRPDEVYLIKCFDSKVDGRARRCPHTAFSTQNDHGPERESIEIRCLVFWENESPE